MAQQYLDSPKVCAALQKVSCEGMSKRMGEGTSPLADHPSYSPISERLAPNAEPKCIAGLDVGQERSSVMQVMLHRLDSHLADWNHSVPIAFASDRQHFHVGVSGPHACHFGYAKAGAVENLEERSISQADGGIDWHLVEHRRNDSLRQRLWKSVRKFGGDEILGGVAVDEAASSQVGVERSDCGNLSADRPSCVSGIREVGQVGAEQGTINRRDIRFSMVLAKVQEL